MTRSSFILFLFAIQCLFADLWIVEDIEELPKTADKPLFISLGSTCVPAGILRNCGLRSAAFPLDWLMSLDNEGLIKAIQEDFDHFLDDDFLIPDNFLLRNASGASLIHLDYHFEFVHEGDFFGLEYEKNMQGLKERYQRRIDRFRGLKDYRGTVIFIRCCYRPGLIDPHRYFRCKEIVDISDEDSLKLYSALKERFPKLKIMLVIMNEGDPPLSGIVIERELNDEIIKVRHCFPSQPELMEAFGKFLIEKWGKK
jgi:hypothetical protein